MVSSLDCGVFCVLWFLLRLLLSPHESQQQQHGHHYQQEHLQASNYELDTQQGNYIHPAPPQNQSLVSELLILTEDSFLHGV